MSDFTVDGLQLRQLDKSANPAKGSPDWPSERPRLCCNDENKLSLQNSDLKLDADHKVIFEGNGQVSAVGDLSFLTGATSPTEQLRIFANGNIGIGTAGRPPSDKLEVAGSLKLENGEAVNKFSNDANQDGDNDQAVLTAKAIKTYVDNKASELPDESVTDRKLAPNAVTTDKMADNSVTTPKIQDSAITQSKLANNAVTTGQIVDGSITKAKLSFDIPTGSSQWQGVDGGPISYSKGNVGIGTGENPPQAKLQIVGGAIMPSAGNLETTGIMFPKNPFGGSGDAAWIRYYARTGEACTLEIGISNDPDDHIALMPFSGNVGIGTIEPQDKLDVAGNLRILTDSNPIRFTSAWSDFSSGSQASAKNQAEISNDTGQFKTLMIVGNKSAGGERRVSVWDTLTVNGEVYTTGNVGIGTKNPEAALHIFSPPPSNDPTGGGYIKFFDKASEWQYECSYDGGSDGVFNFTNLGNENGATRFQSLTASPILVIQNKGWIEADLQTPSSGELKENIIDFSAHEAREVLAGLNPVKFNYRSDEEEKLRVGFIAEDTPDLLASKDKKTISPLDIVAVLTKVIKQQQEELSSLKERLNALEAKV